MHRVLALLRRGALVWMVTISELSILCCTVPLGREGGFVETRREGNEQVYCAIFCLSGREHLKKTHKHCLLFRHTTQDPENMTRLGAKTWLRKSESFILHCLTNISLFRLLAHHDAVFRRRGRELGCKSSGPRRTAARDLFAKRRTR